MREYGLRISFPGKEDHVQIRDPDEAAKVARAINDADKTPATAVVVFREVSEWEILPTDAPDAP